MGFDADPGKPNSAAVAPLAIVIPAAAQDVGVRVGPFETGVGPIMKGGVITIITVTAA
jgi:hypothetical protein